MQSLLFLPKSSWTPPIGFPLELLDSSEPIALDLETYDPLLDSQGASWRFGEGRVIGIALATDRQNWYFPIAHDGGGNLPRNLVLRFFKNLLQTERTVYLANAQYDLGWMYYAGLFDKINFRIEDVQINEALLNEEHPDGYSLDALSLRYLGKTKNETLLNEAAAHFGVDPKKKMHKIPAMYVGQYAETDARNTYDVAQRQTPLLHSQGLLEIWNIECDLIPIIHYMGRRGIRIDEDAAYRLNDEMLEIEKQYNFDFDPLSNPSTTEKLLKEGFNLPQTEAGNYAANKKVLKSLAHNNNLPQQISEFRSLNLLRKTFTLGAVENSYMGRVYPEFVQVARDDGGTRTGRMACKNPNIQQVPKRSVLGKKIRKLYIADEDVQWGSFDYNSQEPRFQVHFGLTCKFQGAEAVRDSFIQGKKLYTWMEENIKGVSYDMAKALVLGRSYGMGTPSISEMIGYDEDETEQILEQFDSGVPYISLLFDMANAKAQQRGYIRTILGRRRRFEFYKPRKQFKDEGAVFGYKQARQKWEGEALTRAFTRKAFNALIQGSSADQTKKAIVEIYKATGLVPYSQVHDEINYPIMTEKQVRLVDEIMRNCIEGLLCPFVVDIDLGKTW